MARVVLEATLGASYGIYGPAFELGKNRPREAGSEEYLDSEQYQLRHSDLDRSDSLVGFIGRMNCIRRDNPALQDNWSLNFHQTDSEQIICYSKRTGDRSNMVLVVVNLDPHHTHSGWLDLSLEELELHGDESFQVHDLLSETRLLCRGSHNYVELNPDVTPAHVFRVRRQIRTEREFDYSM